MVFLEMLGAVVVGIWLHRRLSDLYYHTKWKIRDAKMLKEINAKRTAEGLESFLSWEEYNTWDLQQLYKALEEADAAAAAAEKRSAAAKKAAATKAAAKKPVAKKAPAKKTAAKAPARKK